MASRLSSVARVVGLLNPQQYGSLAGLSTSNCTTLTHKIKTLQIAKRKVSSLFVDITAAVDNVNRQQLSVCSPHSA